MGNKQLQTANSVSVQTTAMLRQKFEESWGSTKVSSSTSVIEVVKMAKNRRQIVHLGKDAEGNMMGETVWQAIILRMVKFLGASWESDQISECAKLCYQETYWFTVPELKLFDTQVKSGHYKSNKNFSPGLLMEWLNDYATKVHNERGSVWAYAWRQDPEPDAPPLTDEQIAILKNQVQAFVDQFGEKQQVTFEKTRHDEINRRELLIRNEMAYLSAKGQLSGQVAAELQAQLEQLEQAKNNSK